MIYHCTFNSTVHKKVNTQEKRERKNVEKYHEVRENTVAAMQRYAYQTMTNQNLNLLASVDVDVDVLICLFGCCCCHKTGGTTSSAGIPCMQNIVN